VAEHFDESELMDRVDGDVEFLAETVEMLVSDGPALLASIRAAIDAGDAGAVGRHAHALKGMISNFCAPATQEQALALEKMGKCGDLAGAPGSLTALEQSVASLTGELQTFVRARAG